MLRVLLVSRGSRGDVEPYVCLALALRARGVDAAVAVCEDSVEWVTQYAPSVPAFALFGDARAFLQSEAYRAALYASDQRALMRMSLAFFDPLESGRVLMRVLERFAPDVVVAHTGALAEARMCVRALDRQRAASASAVSSSTATSTSSAWSARRAVLLINSGTVPFLPSARVAPVVFVSSAFRWGWLNRLVWWAADALNRRFKAPRVALLASELGVEPLAAADYDLRNVPSVFGYSDLLEPTPDDWDAQRVCVSGPWHAPAEMQELPAAVREFLDAGDAPVYVGFGSMPVRSRAQLLDAVREASAALGMRFLVLGGWSAAADGGASDSLPAGVLLYSAAVPHSLLFPRCACAVHHGGSGTTHASVLAGRPTVVFPLLVDQPYWARRIAALGVGPSNVVPLPNLSGATLTAQVRAALQPEVVARAASLGQQLRSRPNGAQVAADFILRQAGVKAD